MTVAIKTERRIGEEVPVNWGPVSDLTGQWHYSTVEEVSKVLHRLATEIEAALGANEQTG
jgi:hypothetical protein